MRIHDFQERNEWTTHLEDYRDMYHFSPKISSALVTEIAADHERLTPENVDERNRRLREMGLAADPEKIIAGALASSPAR